MSGRNLSSRSRRCEAGDGCTLVRKAGRGRSYGDESYKKAKSD